MFDANGWIDGRGREGGEGSRAYTEKSRFWFGVHSGLELAFSPISDHAYPRSSSEAKR